jgi:ribonuclease BN (tRNA processing enzyme)
MHLSALCTVTRCLIRSAGVRTLMLYHLIPGSPAITDEAWAALVRPHFAGPIIVGRDLLTV